MSIEAVLPYLTDNINSLLLSLPREVLKKLTEIRIRRCRPLVLVFGSNSLFITENGKLLNHISENTYKTYDEEFDVLFKRICNYSVQTVVDDLANGFVTIDGGNRVGVASTAIIKNDDVYSVKEITSLNIRIAREVKDCARQIMNILFVNRIPSIIVASAPSGGKTTFLRDFSRLLSSGFNNSFRKVTIVDERGEIAFKCGGKITADVGLNTDVLSYFPKAKGIETALRTLSPDFIVCDEITNINEVYALRQGFLSGVGFAVSVHCSNKKELAQKPIVKRLIELGEFEYIVLLNNYTDDFEIMEVSELKGEVCGNYSDEFCIGINRNINGSST